LAGWFGAYSALFSMPEMFYIEPVNELVEELTRGAVMACREEPNCDLSWTNRGHLNRRKS